MIYQNAEDSLEEPIKPRFLEAGADCNRVLVIDESVDCLSMTDGRLVWAYKIRPVFKAFGEHCRGVWLCNYPYRSHE